MTTKRKAPAPVSAYFDGKAVALDHIEDRKMRFYIACMRVLDNAKEGFVREGDEIYHLTQGKRSARRLTGDEKDRALVEIEKATAA